jgi:hypothetical protein
MGASDVGNPQSNNLYAYVENNPVDNIDPNGLDLASLIYAVSSARELFEYAPCRMLFGNKDPRQLLDNAPISIRYTYSYIRRNPTTGVVSLGRTIGQFEPGGVEGVTYEGIGIVFSEFGSFGSDSKAVRYDSYALNTDIAVGRSDWLALAVIHELLHYSNAPAPFSHKDQYDNEVNYQNSRYVFAFCFALNPIWQSRKPVTTTPGQIDTNITLRPVGGGGGGVSNGGGGYRLYAPPSSWFENIQDDTIWDVDVSGGVIPPKAS